MSKIRDLVVYLNLKYCLDWECQIGDWFLSAVKMGKSGFKLDFKGLDFEWKNECRLIVKFKIVWEQRECGLNWC